jgi:hypothetical protein
MNLHSPHRTNKPTPLKRDKNRPSTTTMPSRNTSTTSSTTAYTYNEQTSLLPHEQGSAILSPHPRPPTGTKQPSTTSATASLQNILTLHPRQIAMLEALRTAEEEAATLATEGEEEETEEEMNRHVLSRIDCIEIDLWHERIRDYEAAELGLLHAEELGLIRHGGSEEGEAEGEQEGEGQRLSRVQTYVDEFADLEGGEGGGKRRKMSSVQHTARLGSTSLSLDHFHPYFWVDVMGICLLVILILVFLVGIGLEVRYDREGICEGRGIGAQGFWIAVQMVVAMGAGLMLQVPVHRGLAPFVLPLWVVGTFGSVVGFKAWAGCLRD